MGKFSPLNLSLLVYKMEIVLHVFMIPYVSQIILHVKGLDVQRYLTILAFFKLLVLKIDHYSPTTHN